MKKTRILQILLAVLTAGIFSSCEDDFTEKDALDAQQTIDLSVYVINNFNTSGVSEASVSIIKDGNLVTAQTNELGIATFNDVNIGGGLPVTVEKEGFTKTQRLVNVSVSNYREGQFTTTVEIYSLTENTAIVRGKIEIETDLTNEDAELVPAGTELIALLNDNGINTVEITTTVDENGNYEFVLPANRAGLNYQINYPTLTIDQTIAKNRNEGEEEFPATLPEITTISTVFNPRGSAVSVPSVPSIFATVPAPVEADGIQGIVQIDFNDIDADGGINDLERVVTGTGYSPSSNVPVTITSLFEGTGVNVVWPTDANGSFFFSEDIIDSGAGYPDFSNANRRSAQSPGLSTSLNVQTGEILIRDGNYGTGTSRAEEIE